MPLLAQDAAAAWLADLAALWQDGQSRPLAFAPDAAFAWLEKLDKDDDEAAAWKADCDVFEERQGFGVGHDAWFRLAVRPQGMLAARGDATGQNGRASCRAQVWKYAQISGVSGPLKNKKIKK